jgi:hypothetical protein
MTAVCSAHEEDSQHAPCFLSFRECQKFILDNYRIAVVGFAVTDANVCYVQTPVLADRHVMTHETADYIRTSNWSVKTNS